MSKHERTARIEGVDADGVFQMTLATEGEASDGHILSIKGGQIPERMPLLSSHWNDPESALGSITQPQKALKDSPPRLRATGQIEMEGPKGDVRRDLAHMIAKGHISAVSIRWDEVPGKTIRRVNLPSDHPYHVDSETATGPERWGSFFEEWVAREGSIVALGADIGAVIGRADETEGEVSAFWRAMAEDAGSPDEPDAESKVAATLAALRADVHAAVDAGISPADITNALGAVASTSDLVSCRFGDEMIFLPASAADQLAEEREERELAPTSVEPDPKPDQATEPEEAADQRSPLELGAPALFEPIPAHAWTDLVNKIFDASVERSSQRFKELIRVATGKVTE